MTDETGQRLAAAVERLADEMRATRTKEPTHPADGWCEATTQAGARCIRDAVLDGLCKLHWRTRQNEQDAAASGQTVEDRHDEAVQAALADMSGWSSASQVRAAAKLKGADAQAALARLKRRGLVWSRSNPRNPRWTQWRSRRGGRANV